MVQSIGSSVRYFHQKCVALGLYPGSLKSASLFLTLYTAMGLDLLHIEDLVPTLLPSNLGGDVSRRLGAGLVYWLGLSLLRKFLLRQLFLYHGWIFEGSKRSWRTKLFGLAVRTLRPWSKLVSKSLYSYQGLLPTLQLPDVRQSVTKHLESMKPLLVPSKYNELEKKATDFLDGPAWKLQMALKLKWWLTPNYISDWWEENVYLRSRAPLLINSSYWFVDSFGHRTSDQAARAAQVTWKSLDIRREIEDRTLETLVPQGLIPMCNWQYSRLFNTTRIPGEAKDSLREYPHGDHIIVLHRGRYFKLNIYHEGTRRLLTMPEWQLQYRRILIDRDVTSTGETKLAALTAWDRTSWAKARKKFFMQGSNRISLEAVESSVFFLQLSDEEMPHQSLEDVAKSPAEQEKKFLCSVGRDGCSRWLDKSINFVVSKNGWVGGCIEHTWGDALISSHAWELNIKHNLGLKEYDSSGFISEPVDTVPAAYEKLNWTFSKDLLADIEEAEKCALRASKDLDLGLLVFNQFGKKAIKGCGVSPDAFAQMVLQLAYYRNQGRFDLTYEPCITRFYYQGRTETIRPCTEESCKWVLAMESNASVGVRRELLKAACEKHQRNYKEAMCGRAGDRHLFGLYVASKYLRIESPYLEEALGTPWSLSTSQLAVHQTLLEHVECSGGGFGAVDKAGYGVAYILAGEDVIYFNVSSYKSCPKTDSKTFVEEIRKAMVDARKLFVADNSYSANAR